MAHYVDPRGGRTYPIEPGRWRGDDGAPLTVAPLPAPGPADLDRSRRGVWRYRAALPPVARPVSLGEGGTPLVPLDLDGVRVLAKLEFLAPTGSFKDRGTTAMLSYLAGHGVTDVIEDSSGNGGASVAAYGAAAGVAVRLLVPAATSPAKLAQARAYGAAVTAVPGDRTATARRALVEAAHTPYAGHNWHPFFLQGVKTLAYELWEDLGFRAPSAVVTVAGAGSIVLGLDLGFRELRDAGLIEALPRLLVAQPAHCAPVHAALTGGTAVFAPTVAEGTAIREPVRLPEVVGAVRRSGGASTAVAEDAILPARDRLARLGLYVEPTSAGAAAAVTDFAARGLVDDPGSTVVVLTGSGLKTPG